MARANRKGPEMGGIPLGKSLGGAPVKDIVETVPMRILIAGASHKDMISIRQILSGDAHGYEFSPAATAPELAAFLKQGRQPVLLAASSTKGWDASATLRLSAQVAPDCVCIGLAAKGKHAEARRLVEAGALDAFPIDQLWRLPLALARVRDFRARLRGEGRTRALEILLETAKTLSGAHRVEEFAGTVAHAARRLAQADGAAFVLRDGDKCHYADEDAVRPLWRGRRYPVGSTFSGWAMLHKRPVAVSDIYRDARTPMEMFRSTFVVSLAAVPIRAADPVGAIEIYWDVERSVSDDEVAQIRLLAEFAAQALENAQAFAGLERRMRERTSSLEAVNKELEAFARSVSHDLRSPLAVIVGYADLLTDEARVSLAKPDRAKVHDIRAAAMRMNALIDDMLRLSQVIQREVDHRRVDLSALAEDILARLAASEPGRKVAARVEPGLWAFADPGLMRIAMGNLLSNAWKYSNKREVAHIEVGRMDVPGKGPAFFVRDDGAGFDMEQVRRLFKPFQRLHSMSEYPGSGIGLATVSRVLEKHGGSVWAEGEKGKGAAFFFRLPGAPGRAPQSPEYEDAASSVR